MRTYRIAFVNPYATAAEVQAFESLRRAAESMGITLEHRSPKDLREDDTYDFVIPVAFTPKTTSHPSLLSCHSPRTVYVDSEEMFGAIASHDGFLSISENLQDFFSGLCAAYDKPLAHVGAYYNCPQSTDVTTDLPLRSASGDLALCYFGINWDMRAEPLFRELAKAPYMRIYGPADSWRTVRPQAYKGQLPFDGTSVQREYAKFGVGLVCLGYEHLMDDIISNRVFEISSVGAASISPDTPWMRRHFGDSALYYDPFAPIDVIARQIDTAFQAIRADPQAASARAAQARAIFERSFEASVMLDNAVRHFERWREAAEAQDRGDDGTQVDVMILGDDREAIGRTLSSLERQRSGRFRVFLSSVVTDHHRAAGRIAEIVPALGSPSETLGALNAPYSMIVEAGDRFLSHHVQRLLAALHRSPAAALAYADALTPDLTDVAGVRISRQGPLQGDGAAVLDRLALGCVMLRTDRLRAAAARLDEPRGRARFTAAVLASGSAAHAAGATCVLAAKPSAAAFPDGEERVAAALDTAPFLPVLHHLIGPAGSTPFAALSQAVSELTEIRLDGLAPQRVFEGGMIGRDVADSTDIIHVEVPLGPGRLEGVSDFSVDLGGCVRLHPGAAFEIALSIDLSDLVEPTCSASVIFGLSSAPDTLFLGMIDAAGEIVARTITPKSRKPLRVWVNAAPGSSPTAAIIQAWKRPPAQPVELTSLTLALRLDEFACALGMPELDREQGVEILRRRAITETVGQIPASPLFHPMELNDPRSLYPHSTETKGGGLALRTGRKPWDYFGQLFIPAGAAPGEALNLNFFSAAESFTAFLVNTAFDTVLGERFSMRGGKRDMSLWLPAPEAPQDAYLILQASSRPADGLVVLKSLFRSAGGLES